MDSGTILPGNGINLLRNGANFLDVAYLSGNGANLLGSGTFSGFDISSKFLYDRSYEWV